MYKMEYGSSDGKLAEMIVTCRKKEKVVIVKKVREVMVDGSRESGRPKKE